MKRRDMTRLDYELLQDQLEKLADRGPETFLREIAEAARQAARRAGYPTADMWETISSGLTLVAFLVTRAEVKADTE